MSQTTENLMAQLRAALQEIAATPLWGEEIADATLRAAYQEAHEYDEDGFAPSCDTESTMLRDAVELARAVLAQTASD
jgi:hypothetical protein